MQAQGPCLSQLQALDGPRRIQDEKLCELEEAPPHPRQWWLTVGGEYGHDLIERECGQYFDLKIYTKHNIKVTNGLLVK